MKEVEEVNTLGGDWNDPENETPAKGGQEAFLGRDSWLFSSWSGATVATILPFQGKLGTDFYVKRSLHF